MSESEESIRGWAWPSSSRKDHYFVDGRSLCGKWGWLSKSGLDDTPYVGPDACKACARKFQKRRKDEGFVQINVIGTPTILGENDE